MQKEAAIRQIASVTDFSSAHFQPVKKKHRSTYLLERSVDLKSLAGNSDYLNNELR